MSTHSSESPPVLSTERLDAAMQFARRCLACLPIHCGCMKLAVKFAFFGVMAGAECGRAAVRHLSLLLPAAAVDARAAHELLCTRIVRSVLHSCLTGL